MSVALFVLCPLWANVVTGVAQVPEGYYNGVDGKSSASAILDALFTKISGHTVIAYKSLEPYYAQTDMYADTIWDMYSTCRFTMDDANKQQKAVCDAWNKEHSIPQSWFNEGSPMKSDLFHVYPTDARVNNFRSNLPYGEVAGGNGAGFQDNYQNHGLGKKGSNTFPGYTGTVFEPADEYKGDFARTYFYMVARYRDKALTASGGSVVFTSNKTDLTEFAKNLFLKWHRQDPVSQKEIDRNQAVYGIQGNRNPFIDYPDFVEYVWGDRVGQTINLSAMIPTCDGGGSTPPTPTVKYGVTWSVNGEDQQTDSVAENSKPAMPATPVSCSTESNVFMGWTTVAISGTQDEAPAVLYVQSADFPAATADMTYYAVFAKATTQEGPSVPTKVTFDFGSMGLSGEIKTPFVKEGVTITFDKATAGTPPTFYTDAIRLYAGGTMTVAANAITQIDLTFGASDKNNEISANTGTYSKENSQWTGSANEVVFTIGGTSGHRRFATVAVNMSGQGSVTTYSRYITSCQAATEVETLNTLVSARKILVGGQIYILLGDQIYTITGQRVQ